METLPAGVLLPHAEVLLHVDALHPVQRHHVELPDGLVVLRRVARRHDQPPLRQTLVAEGLALQELQHHGGQGLADAVDLIQEEDALLEPCFSISRYTEPRISLMVYSVTETSLPP